MRVLSEGGMTAVWVMPVLLRARSALFYPQRSGRTMAKRSLLPPREESAPSDLGPRLSPSGPAAAATNVRQGEPTRPMRSKREVLCRNLNIGCPERAYWGQSQNAS